MGLYSENGYLNIDFILKQGCTFNIVVGGRGTGKTYGALTYALDNGYKILYMRRSQSQADLIRTPEFSPYNAVNRERGTGYYMFPITKYNAAICDSETNDKGKIVMKGVPVGYVCALSTISNLRGFDAAECTLLIFDEFIPEVHERPIKNEAEAFFNAYETINRNRELQGKQPMRVLCLANSNQLASPLLLYLNIARKIEKMQEKGKEISIDNARSLAIFNLCDSPISDEKRNTALYKLTAGTTFERMSVKNQFMRETGLNIKSMPLYEYKPLVTVGEICVYLHKSNGRFYVSGHKSGTPTTYDAGERDCERFRRSYGFIWECYIDGLIDFEDYFCEVLFSKYFQY